MNFLNVCGRALNEMDMDTVAKCLHKDFHRILYPKSLGEPTLDREAWIKRISELGTGFGVGYTT